MTAFDDQFAAGSLPLLFERHGTSIAYRRRGGAAQPLTAILGQETRSEEHDDEHRLRVRRRQVTISRDPALSWGGVADPATVDAVRIGTEDWSVEDIRQMGGSFVALTVVRRESLERSRGGYRRATSKGPHDR